MRIASFHHQQQSGYGVVSDAGVRPAPPAFLARYPDLKSVLAGGALAELAAAVRDSAPLDPGALPARAWLVHQGSGDKIALPLAWNPAGQAHGEWTIPPASRLGRYQVLIGAQVAGEFRVEQFRVPTMKAILKPPAAPAWPSTTPMPRRR